MSDTRAVILDAAERLYAERGLDGVSLRQITEAAGQRNNAAVHYHFGGRDGLVRALFETRWAELEEQRAAMLAQLDAQGRGDDIRELLLVMLAPFAQAEDGYWVRFVARMHEDPRFNPFAGPEPYGAGFEAMATSSEISRRLREASGLAPEVAEIRMFLVTTMAVHAVADRHAMLAAGLKTSIPEPADLLDGLVEAAVGALSR